MNAMGTGARILARAVLPEHGYEMMRAEWRKRRAQILSQSGAMVRTLRHPMPMSRPWRRSMLDVSRNAGIGDVLMCTPTLRELKRLNPTAHVRFYTDFPSLVRGLPYLDEVLPFQDQPSGAIYLDYLDALPPRVHIAKIIGDALGLKITDVRPDCMIDTALVGRFRESWSALPRPHIVVHRYASSFTPNKDWPESYWLELIQRLAERATVIEIGSRKFKQDGLRGHYIDLRDRTSIEEFVAAIAAGDILVGTISGPVHVAAAAKVPAVVIDGGYEHPINTTYPGNLCLYTDVSCAPCWLREPCPFDLKCLKAIRPGTVESAIWSLYETGDWQRIAEGATSIMPMSVAKDINDVQIWHGAGYHMHPTAAKLAR
jgi:ADP-heptose:LPS heptosyltransferase